MTDDEIKIGNTMPYSGSPFGFSVNGRAQAPITHHVLAAQFADGVNVSEANGPEFDRNPLCAKT